MWKCQHDVQEFSRSLVRAWHADFFQPNNVFTCGTHGKVKMMLDNDQGALQELDKANVFEPNNAFTLKMNENVK